MEGGGQASTRLLPVCGSVQRSLRAGPLSRGPIGDVAEVAMAHTVALGAHSLFYRPNKCPSEHHDKARRVCVMMIHTPLTYIYRIEC